MSVDGEKYRQAIEQVVNPRQAPVNLQTLCLAGIPPRDQIHQDIEQKLLLPQKLPDHWLSTYQMYDSLS